MSTMRMLRCASEAHNVCGHGNGQDVFQGLVRCSGEDTYLSVMSDGGTA
jgi:hypothetical protein